MDNEIFNALEDFMAKVIVSRAAITLWETIVLYCVRKVSIVRPNRVRYVNGVVSITVICDYKRKKN